MIYFLKSSLSDHIKIGYSQDPESRAKDLQVPGARILAVVSGDRSVEAELHKRFAHLHVGREWYRPGPDLLAFLKKLQKSGATTGNTTTLDGLLQDADSVVAQLWRACNDFLSD